MLILLDRALALDKIHGPHRYPKNLEAESDYDKYGTLRLCVAMSECYSDLVIIDQCPALKYSVPAGNLGSVEEESKPKSKNPNG